ncbi:complement factor H like 5 [Echeneis naucrates]|uniref:complement factor H like 5 n=1 Tax=Echeneis naucrates TaxID=173247 RepID=UPI0011138AAF|nr:complement factor H-related protein 3-like [Echeneis naucrates]
MGIRGIWDPTPECERVTCNRQDVQNADVVNVKRKYINGEQANYVCTNDNIGEFSLTSPVGCGKPTHVENADISGRVLDSYQHNERVQYRCQSWYLMEGEPFKTCKDGTWTGILTCLKPCTVTREELNRHNIDFMFSRSDKLYMQHGDYVHFICAKRSRAHTMMRQPCTNGVISYPTCV